MKYPLVILDFDGTLADSFPWFMSVINSVADKYHFNRIGPNDYAAMKGCAPGEILNRMGMSLWKIPFVAAHMRKLVNRDAHMIMLFDGVSQFLSSLSQSGATLAIVSSNSYNNICQILGRQNLELIRYYECDVSMFGKAGRLKKILKKSGVLSGQAIYIGDEIRDIEAAKKACMASGAVAWGYNSFESLKEHQPSELFANFDEILVKLKL